MMQVGVFHLEDVIFGLYDNSLQKFNTIELSVSFFKSPLFENQAYLSESAHLFSDMFEKNGCSPMASGQTNIYVCPGFVNNGISDILSQKGYTVHRAAIGEPLQTQLEKSYADYIYRITGQTFYYDPKLLPKKQIGRRFFQVINWIKANNRFDIAKTGWKYFKRNYGNSNRSTALVGCINHKQQF